MAIIDERNTAVDAVGDMVSWRLTRGNSWASLCHLFVGGDCDRVRRW
jgi:hypothetical protein